MRWPLTLYLTPTSPTPPPPRRHIREADGILNELTPAVRVLGEVASTTDSENAASPLPPQPTVRYITSSLPSIIDYLQSGGGSTPVPAAAAAAPSTSAEPQQPLQQQQPAVLSPRAGMRLPPMAATSASAGEASGASAAGAAVGDSLRRGSGSGSGSAGGGLQRLDTGGSMPSLSAPPTGTPSPGSGSSVSFAGGLTAIGAEGGGSSSGGGGSSSFAAGAGAAAPKFAATGKPLTQRTLVKVQPGASSSSVSMAMGPTGSAAVAVEAGAGVGSAGSASAAAAAAAGSSAEEPQGIEEALEGGGPARTSPAAGDAAAAAGSAASSSSPTRPLAEPSSTQPIFSPISLSRPGEESKE